MDIKTVSKISYGSPLFATAKYVIKYNCVFTAGLGGSVGCAYDWQSGGSGFDPRQIRLHCFVEIDHEIFPSVILSLLLTQEEQLSVSGERMCTSTG